MRKIDVSSFVDVPQLLHHRIFQDISTLNVPKQSVWNHCAVIIVPPWWIIWYQCACPSVIGHNVMSTAPPPVTYMPWRFTCLWPHCDWLFEYNPILHLRHEVIKDHASSALFPSLYFLLCQWCMHLRKPRQAWLPHSITNHPLPTQCHRKLFYFPLRIILLIFFLFRDGSSTASTLGMADDCKQKRRQ